MENDRVRVPEYRDRPGDRTTPHAQPDSVMITLSSFRRRLSAGAGSAVEVSLESGQSGGSSHLPIATVGPIES